MPFYEVIFETGSHSVAEYADDAEALSAIGAHHDRAITGAVGGPSGHPAERIKRVLKYKDHPGDYNASQLVTTDQIVEELNLLSMGTDSVSAPEAMSAIALAASPVLDTRETPHESMYKATEVEELSPSDWQVAS